MIEMVIWLVVIAAFVFRALKKNGTLDELFAGAKKRKENKAERVVYEQPEEGSGKKEKKKKGPGIRVPKHTGLAVTAVVIVLAAAVLSFDSFYTLSEVRWRWSPRSENRQWRRHQVFTLKFR